MVCYNNSMDDYELENIASDIINDSLGDLPEQKEDFFVEEDVASDIRSPEPKPEKHHEDFHEVKEHHKKSPRPRMVDSFRPIDRSEELEDHNHKDAQSLHEDVTDQIASENGTPISEFVSSHSKIAYSDQPAFRSAPAKKIQSSSMPVMGKKSHDVEEDYDEWTDQPSHHDNEPTWTARPVRNNDFGEAWPNDPIDEDVSSLGSDDKIEELLDDYEEPEPIYSSKPKHEEKKEEKKVEKKAEEKPMILEEHIVEDDEPVPSFATTQKRSHRVRTMLISLIMVTGIVGIVISVISLTSNPTSKPQEPSSGNTPYASKNTSTQSKYTIDQAEPLNLSSKTDDVTIMKAGAYRLTGNLDHSLVINADDEVALYLDNIVINSSNTAAIKNISKSQLTISIIGNTTNSIIDNGESEQNGCIYSEGPLVINGDQSGSLNIAGQQKDGKGIFVKSADLTINDGSFNITSVNDSISTSDGSITINGGIMNIVSDADGIDSSKDLIINGGQVVVVSSDKDDSAAITAKSNYEINGGYVFAMGTEKGKDLSDSSKQKTFVLGLDEVQKGEGTYYLVESNSAGDIRTPMFSIYAAKSFKHLTVSAPEFVDKATYRIYQGGVFKSTSDNVEIGIMEDGVVATAGGLTDFQIDSIINAYGDGANIDR